MTEKPMRRSGLIGKAVEVAWADSYGTGAAWEGRRDLKPLRPVHIRSVGYVIEDSAVCLTLAQSVSRDQVCGRLSIPRGCIKTVRRVR